MRPPSAALDLLRTGGFIRLKALALGYSSRSTGCGAAEPLKRERARRRAGIGSCSREDTERLSHWALHSPRVVVAAVLIIVVLASGGGAPAMLFGSSRGLSRNRRLEGDLGDRRKKRRKNIIFIFGIQELHSYFLQYKAVARKLLRCLTSWEACEPGPGNCNLWVKFTVFLRIICSLATIYLAMGLSLSGAGLIIDSNNVVPNPMRPHLLLGCIIEAKRSIVAKEGDQTGCRGPTGTDNRFLFEGHLTVDPEPPQPDWLVMSNLLSAAATLPAGQSSEENPASSNSSEAAANLLRELADRLDDIVPMILDDAPAAPRVPPASKEVVAKLPVTTVTDEFLAKLDADAECAICKENLVLNDKMQELPCKHMFHPPCLKPWLDEHNSCPICRHELQTDDHNYESWKEREREAEEERKGAANAVREGEYMYV
nr:E3 ubiquitin-protein ligase AIP2 [Ipomoea batatas]